MNDRKERPIPTRAPSSVGRRAKSLFWASVRGCLVKFHSYPKNRARIEAASLRGKIERLPREVDGDVIYHDEPFYVACDVAGMHDPEAQSRLLEANAEAYDTLIGEADPR